MQVSDTFQGGYPNFLYQHILDLVSLILLIFEEVMIPLNQSQVGLAQILPQKIDMLFLVQRFAFPLVGLHTSHLNTQILLGLLTFSVPLSLVLSFLDTFLKSVMNPLSLMTTMTMLFQILHLSKHSMDRLLDRSTSIFFFDYGTPERCIVLPSYQIYFYKI